MEFYLYSPVGSGGGNRTPVNGFGDRRNAIIPHRNKTGGPKGNRTPPSAVTGRCTNRYTMGPYPNALAGRSSPAVCIAAVDHSESQCV